MSALWSNSIPTIHVFVVHFREDSILSGLSSFGFELDFNIFRPRKGGTLDRPVCLRCLESSHTLSGFQNAVNIR